MSKLFSLSTLLLATTAAISASASAADFKAPFDPALTAWGAEVSGNSEGTIPAYTGGVENPPQVDYATGIRPDPFKDDQVLFWIDADNMDQYADKLSPGVQGMLTQYPTFRIAVYPTRRSVSYPDHVIENSIKNVSRCSIDENGYELDVSQGCHGGIPFPVPKNGTEVLWNKKAAYMGGGRVMRTTSYYVKPNGEVVQPNSMLAYEDSGLYDPSKDIPTREWAIRTEYSAPTRVAGQATLIFDGLDGTRRSWSYQPATRRTRLAPDLAGDTPIAAQGGAQLYDMMNMFGGSLEGWNWKLVGKQEMYIPYNIYSTMNGESENCKPDTGLFQPFHVNPECVRWELHRVWHVQATIKEGKRHILQKRDFFFDEDSWIGGVQDTYDRDGQLYQVEWAPLWPDYVKHAPITASSFSVFDLRSRLYVFPMASKSWSMDAPLPPNRLNSDSLSNFILREGGY